MAAGDQGQGVGDRAPAGDGGGVGRPPVEPWSLSDAGHLGTDGRAGRHRMALRPLPPGDWLDPDRHAAAQLDCKARLLDDVPDLVLHDAGTASARRAVVALHRLLRDAQGHPPPDPGDDDVVSTADLLRRCALAAQEDWCCMVREDTWRLRAACVCFPSRWVLGDKHGGTIADIHAPVPGYGEQLGGLVEAFLDRLRPDRPMWRSNWNLWDDARLFQPIEDPASRHWPVPAPEEVGDVVVLRVERQTFRRLSDDAVAFGIRVHQRLLADVARQPGALEVLDGAVRSVDGSPSGSKKLGRLAGPIRAWLDVQRAGHR